MCKDKGSENEKTRNLCKEQTNFHLLFGVGWFQRNVFVYDPTCCLSRYTHISLYYREKNTKGKNNLQGKLKIQKIYLYIYIYIYLRGMYPQKRTKISSLFLTLCSKVPIKIIIIVIIIIIISIVNQQTKIRRLSS